MNVELSPRLCATSVAAGTMLILDATIAIVSVRLHAVPPVPAVALLLIDKSLVAFPLGTYLRRRHSIPLLKVAATALTAAAVAALPPLAFLLAYGVQNLVRLGHLRPEWPTVFVGMLVGELLMVASATAAGLLGAAVVGSRVAARVGSSAT